MLFTRGIIKPFQWGPSVEIVLSIFVGVFVYSILGCLPLLLLRIDFIRKRYYDLTAREGWWINEYTERREKKDDDDETRYGLFKIAFNYSEKKHEIKGYAFLENGTYRAKWKSSSDIIERSGNGNHWGYIYDSRFFSGKSKESLGYTDMVFNGGVATSYYVDFREVRTDNHSSTVQAEMQYRKRKFSMTNINDNNLADLANDFEKSISKDWEGTVSKETERLGKDFIGQFQKLN